MIFVNSMSDLFHKDVPDRLRRARRSRHGDGQLAHLSGADQASRAAARHAQADQLAFAAELDHIWWGVSVEDRKHGLPRIDALREAPAAVRFLSIEPLLEDLGEIDLRGHPLGDRRRRERPRCPADGGGVGARHPRAVRGRTRSRSSSSNGAASGNLRLDAYSTDALTTRCRNVRHEKLPPMRSDCGLSTRCGSGRRIMNPWPLRVSPFPAACRQPLLF